MPSSVDRRAEFEFVTWRQGHLLMTNTVARMSPEWRAERHAEEQRMIFAHFTAMDDGKSRVGIYVCDTPAEAARIVREQNLWLSIMTDWPKDQPTHRYPEAANA